MSVSNLFKNSGGLVWNPDADAINAPDSALLRADNLVPDEQGQLTLRPGSNVIFTAANLDPVNSIYVSEVNGSTVQMANVGSKVYIGTGDSFTDSGFTFDGSGDVAFGDDAYQLFFARGTVKKKYGMGADGVWRSRNWGLPAPTVAPTLAASAFVGTKIADYGTAGESVAGSFTTHEGSSSAVTGYDGTSNGAYSLTPDPATGRASISKTFTAVQNYAVLNEQDQADTDLFDIFVWLEEPRKVDKITIMFGLGDLGSTDPFQSDYYLFEFKVKDQLTVDVKDASSTGAAAYGKAVTKVQSILAPEDVTSIQTPAQVQEVLKRLGRYAGPRSRERTDAQQASPAWTHFSVTRGQFSRIGGTAGKSWATVSSFKVVYTGLPGSSERIFLDSAAWYGGGSRALTGTYKAIYRFAHDNGTYIELGPPSPVSDPVTVTQGNISLTIPATGVSEADYANQIWCYLYGGFLDTYYRFAITGSTASSDAYRIDEFTPPDGAGTGNAYPLDDAVQRGAMIQQGLSIPGGDLTADSSITISIRQSELDAIIENEVLEPGVVGPPDNIVAICGPWLNRMFCVTSDGWLYMSSNKSPASFSVYHALDLRRYGRPLWLSLTTGGPHVGMTGDVIRIAGDGEESPDRVQINFYPDPLGVGNPPVDGCVYTEGNTLIFRSADGLVTMSGSGTALIPTGNTSLLWRGYARHGVNGINYSTGRFRLTLDNGILYLLASEGTDTDPDAIYRVSRNVWSRTTYPTHVFRSIFREPTGRILAGTTTGKLVELDEGTQDVDGSTFTKIPVEVWTPITDGGAPLSRKTAHDLQFMIDTGGETATVLLYAGAATTFTSTYPVVTTLPTPYRINASDFGDFIRAHIRLSGSFYRFTLFNLNLSFRIHAQMMMSFDPGYIIPEGNSDFAWLQEVEIDCISPSDLEVMIYRDDTYFTTLPITVVPNVRSVYMIPVPRNTKGRRLRLRFNTTAADAAGQIGFEPYGVRYRLRPSGNNADVGYQTLFPVGQKP